VTGGDRRSALAERVTAELAALLDRSPRPGLHLVATPIGNLGDITLRALAVLARADLVYCEDTRHSRRLFERYGLSPKLRSLHEHNEEREVPRLLETLAGKAVVALVSDAGTPLVSDPGYKLVRDVIAAGHHVEALPGPSSVLTALAVSGLPTDSFLFTGFLPPKRGARRERLQELKPVAATLVLFEAPGRLADTLADLRDVLGDRPVAVARELTKLYEEVVRGRLGDLAVDAAEGEARGEYVLVIGRGAVEAPTDDDLDAALRAALARASLRDAVHEVTDRFGLPRGTVYARAVALRRADEPSA
jgi:16S rRNA (cytidine1402-2'-O)-methyltransferase